LGHAYIVGSCVYCGVMQYFVKITSVQRKRWSGGAWCTSIVDSSDKVPDNKRSRRIDESIRLGLCQIDHRSARVVAVDVGGSACGWQWV
jgi:hypothetical protein